MSETIISTTPDCEIVTTRTVHAPINVVFEAWANPDHLKNWWGPAGFTNTFLEFDFRPGGKWKFIMHGPDKGNYNNECEFLIIDRPHCIAWKRFSKPLFQVVFYFEQAGEKQTTIIFKMLFDTAAECSKLKPFVLDKNEENFDRLEQELQLMTA